MLLNPPVLLLRPAELLMRSLKPVSPLRLEMKREGFHHGLEVDCLYELPILLSRIAFFIFGQKMYVKIVASDRLIKSILDTGCMMYVSR